jgi:hypothetical protein
MTGEPSRWPITIGTIGVILGVVLILDNVDDLITLRWTATEWQRLLGPYIADWIARTLPPAGWRLVSALVQIGLGGLLIVASVGLRRRSRVGVSRCRLWAWLAIGWTVVAIGLGTLWLFRRAELPSLASPGVGGYVAFGLALALVLLLAFPVFLLVWLSLPHVRAEWEAWE